MLYNEADYTGRKGAIGSFFARLLMDGWGAMLRDRLRRR